MPCTGAPKQSTAALVLLALLSGCATARQPDASGAEKRAFLLAAVAEQAATGPKDCQLYADGLAGRLMRSPYRYEVQTLYYCSLGAECHVVLRVDTGDAQFASDNGAFIRGNVEALATFERQRSGGTSWHQIHPAQARLMLLAERQSPRS